MFITGKFREYSTIRPAGDLLGGVRILGEEEFKQATGYPKGKSPDAPPEPAPEPKPGPKKDCSKRVDELIEALRAATKRMTDIRKNAIAELEKQVPESAKDAELFGRAQHAWLESSSAPLLDTPEGRRRLEEILPEVKTTQDVIVSPEVFLTMGKALREHAMTALGMVSENPESAAQLGDMGDVTVTVEPFPGEKQTINLKPMFGADALSKGPDYVENEFIMLFRQGDPCLQAGEELAASPFPSGCQSCITQTYGCLEA